MKKLVVFMLIAIGLFSITPAFAWVHYYNLTDSDTYVNQTTAGANTNYGSATDMTVDKPASNEKSALIWINGSSYTNNQFVAAAIGLAHSSSNTFYAKLNYCSNYNLSTYNENTTVWSNYSTACGTSVTNRIWAVSSTPDVLTYGHIVTDMINNTLTKRLVILSEDTNADPMTAYTKEYATKTLTPKIALYEVEQGEFWLGSVNDGMTNTNVTFNVTYTNGSHTIIQTNQQPISFIDHGNLTGTVTVSITSYAGSFSTNKYYHTLSDSTTGVVYYPMLTNKTHTNSNEVTFTVTYVTGMAVSNAYIDIYQSINGTWNLINQLLTDSSGTTITDLYETINYKLIIRSSTGTSDPYYITPTSSTYSITIPGSSSYVLNNIFDNMRYGYYPMTIVAPSNNYANFSFYVTDADSKLNFMGLILYNENMSEIKRVNSTSDTGTTIIATINTTALDLVIANYTIDREGYGVYSFNKNYGIRSFTAGNMSLLAFLGNVGSDVTLPTEWKSIIAIFLSIALAGVVGISVRNEVAAVLTAAGMLTFFAYLAWFDWVFVGVTWLLIVGILAWRSTW